MSHLAKYLPGILILAFIGAWPLMWLIGGQRPAGYPGAHSCPTPRDAMLAAEAFQQKSGGTQRGTARTFREHPNKVEVTLFFSDGSPAIYWVDRDCLVKAANAGPHSHTR